MRQFRLKILTKKKLLKDITEQLEFSLQQKNFDCATEPDFLLTVLIICACLLSFVYKLKRQSLSIINFPIFEVIVICPTFEI